MMNNPTFAYHTRLALADLCQSPAWLTVCVLLMGPAAHAQPARADLEAWVQVEMTLFTYENTNLEAEVWSPDKLSIGFPDRLVALSNVADVLQLDDWSVLTGVPSTALPQVPVVSGSELTELAPAVLLVGPRPYAPAESFTMPDLTREAFLALPPSAHDFVSTNRTLSQSPAHRIVYHNAWRQPLLRRSASPAVGLRGGREFGERSEVEGSVLVFAGSARDRLALETNLWLTQFGALAGEQSSWTLPVLPAALHSDGQPDLAQSFTPTRIIQFNQNREMRLAQFHYLDHPALGMLVQVTAYERPLPPVLEENVNLQDTPPSQSPAP